MRLKESPHWHAKRGLALLLWVSLVLPIGGCAMQGRAAATLSAPPVSAELRQETMDLDQYTITATFDPERAMLTCEQRVTWRNRTEKPQDMLYFHTYANAFKREETSPATDPAIVAKTYGERGFDPGEIHFSEVRVNGEAVAFALVGEAETALRVPVGLLAPGESVDVVMWYVLRVPQTGFRFGVHEGIWSFASVFPLAAVFENDAWRLDPYVAVGDPFYSVCANYTFTLDTPESFIPAATGRGERTEQADGRAVWVFDAPAVRDFALTLSQRYKTAQRLTDGVLITAQALDGKLAQKTLDIAETALALYGRLFGTPYPYPTFTVAAARVGGYGGMEYSGLVLIDLDQYADQRVKSGSLELVVAHEVAHQWWYALVGNDQVNQPWLDEALCEYSTMLYFLHTYGQETFNALYEQRIENALRVTLPSDRTIGADIDRFASLSEYAMVVYQRGAGMLRGLHEAVGDTAFFDILRTYIADHRFGLASRADFERTVNQVTGANWSGYLDDYLDGTP